MTAAGNMAAGQFGDTTYTKVFVGGLAWETQTETMKNYFEQFGEILEAVVITEKHTGRSKGYGFVTFSDSEAAARACVDATPMIDGRRANCNIASLGLQKSRPATPKHGGGRNFRVTKSFQATGEMGTAAFHSTPTTFPHYAIQQGIPYNVYGYSTYSPDYTYPTGYYNLYGGAAAAGGGQYPLYGGAASAFYPYFQFGHGGTGASYAQGQQGGSYGMQYPHIFQYPSVNTAAAAVVAGFAPPHHYGAPTMSLVSSPPAEAAAGMTVALTSPTQPSQLVPRSFRLIPTHFTPSAASASKQSLA